MTTNAFKKVQYGYHGKNGVFSDHTERIYSETYSSNKIILTFSYSNFTETSPNWPSSQQP